MAPEHVICAVRNHWLWGCALESRQPLGRDTGTHQGPTWLPRNLAVPWGSVSSSQLGLCSPGAQRCARWPCPLPCQCWHRAEHASPCACTGATGCQHKSGLSRSWHSAQRAKDAGKENLLLSRASGLCPPPPALPLAAHLGTGMPLAGNQAGTLGSGGRGAVHEYPSARG